MLNVSFFFLKSQQWSVWGGQIRIGAVAMGNGDLTLSPHMETPLPQAADYPKREQAIGANSSFFPEVAEGKGIYFWGVGALFTKTVMWYEKVNPSSLYVLGQNSPLPSMAIKKKEGRWKLRYAVHMMCLALSLQ